MALGNGAVGQLNLLVLVSEAEESPCMSHGQATFGEEKLNFRRQPEEPERVGDSAPFLSGAAGNFLVAELELLGEALKGFRRLDGI